MISVSIQHIFGFTICQQWLQIENGSHEYTQSFYRIQIRLNISKQLHSLVSHEYHHIWH